LNQEKQASLVGCSIFGFLLGIGASFLVTSNWKNFDLPHEYGVVAMVLIPFVGLLVGYAIGGSMGPSSERNTKQESPPFRELAPQIAGKNCSACNTNLIMESNGFCCPNCRRILCHNCEPDVPCSKCQTKIV